MYIKGFKKQIGNFFAQADTALKFFPYIEENHVRFLLKSEEKMANNMILVPLNMIQMEDCGALLTLMMRDLLKVEIRGCEAKFGII